MEEVAIAIFCNKEIAKEYGLDAAVIKKYQIYHIAPGIASGRSDSSGSFGDGGGGD